MDWWPGCTHCTARLHATAGATWFGYLRLQLRTYTIWNLTFCALRVALKQKQWDPFLLLNSIGIVNGFRTAFCQGIDRALVQPRTHH